MTYSPKGSECLRTHAALHPELATFRAQPRCLFFTFEVRDELGNVGEGIHELFVIDLEKQRQRLQEKLARWKPTS